jgi:hypothetical protein
MRASFKGKQPSDGQGLIMPLEPQDVPPAFPLTETDRWVLSQTDEEYQAHTWEELKQIISEPDALAILRLGDRLTP